MAIIPPSNFWSPYNKLQIIGVLSGVDPLYTVGTAMHVKAASLLDSGVVTTGAQSFAGAKQFGTSIALSDAYAVTATSNDTTLAGDRATALVTEHATKTYVDNAIGTPFVTAVTLPLYMSGTNMNIWDAGANRAGYVTTQAQDIRGAKRFMTSIALADSYVVTATSNDTTLAADSATSLVTEHAAKTYIDTHGYTPPAMTPYAVITADGAGALTSSGRYVIDNSDANASKFKIYSPNGTKLMQVAIDQLWNVGQLYSTAATVELWGNAGKAMSLDSTLVHNYLTTQSVSADTGAMVVDGGMGIMKKLYVRDGINVVSLTAPQLSVGYNVLNYTDFTISSTGDLTVNASGNDINFHSTDAVHVLNTTAATSKTTGALQVIGGVGVSGGIYCSQASCLSNALPQLVMYYDLFNSSYMNTNSHGLLTITTSGGEIATERHSVVRILNEDDSTDSTTGALVVSGGVGVAKDMHSARLRCSSALGNQLIVAYDIDDSLSIDVANGGAVTVNATGSSISTNITPVIRVLNQTDATNSSTGSLNTAGGMSCAKSCYVGAGMHANLAYANTFVGTNPLNSNEVYLQDNGSTGSCGITISTGGNTNIVTSGTLLNNSYPIANQRTLVDATAWIRCLGGVVSSVHYRTVGNVCYARFEDAPFPSIATDPITSYTSIPVGFRPVAPVYQPVVVYYEDPLGPSGQTQTGVMFTDASFYIWFYSTTSFATITGQNWPVGYGAGWKPFVATWLLA